MAITAERLRVEVEADTSSAEKALGDLGDQGSKIPGWAKAAGAALAGAFAVDKIVDGVKAAVGAASDLQQAVGGVEAVFGTNAAQVNTWATGAAKNLGLSKTAYSEFATVVGSQLKNMGVAQDQVAGSTNDLIGKGADLAATFGGSTSDAVSALSSLLRGETDPIERYGVSIKQADIEAQKAKMGLAGLTGEADKAATSQATLALLTEQTAAATGKFASEGDTFAGVQQRMSAGWTNIVATIGGAFLPVATDVLSWASDAMDWFGSRLPGAMDTLSGWFGTIGTAFSAGLAAFREGDVTSDGLVGAFETVGNALRTVWQIAGPILQQIMDVGREAFSALLSGLQETGGGVGSALAPLLSLLPQVVSLFNPLGLVFKALMPVLPQLAGLVGQLVGTLASALVPILTTLVPVIAQVAGVLVGALSQAFVALMPAILSLLPMVQTLVGILGGVLLTVIQSLTPIILMLADVLAELLPALMPLVSAVLDVVGALLPLVAVAGDLIGAILPPLVSLLMALLEPILALIPPLIAALVPALLSVAKMITDYLVPAATFMAAMLGALVAAIAPVVAAILGGLVKALGGLIQWVVNTASSIVQFVAEAIAGFGRFATGAGEKVGEVIQWFRDLPGKITGAISGLWQTLYNAGANIIEGLAKGIGSAVGKVTGAIKDVMGKVRDFLPFSPAKTGPFSGRGWTLYSGRSITKALADGMTDNLRQVQQAGLAVASSAAMNIPGATIGAPNAYGAAGGPSGTPGGASSADALGVGSASAYQGPTSITVVDADGNLIGTMRVQAGKVATGKITPLDEGRTDW